MRVPIEDLSHLDHEGIEYGGSEDVYSSEMEESVQEMADTYPEPVIKSVQELGGDLGNADFIDESEEVLKLYRGDSQSNLEEMGFNSEKGALEEDLSRDFPIYFTTSEEEALEHAGRKPDTNNTYLLKAEVPFDNLDIVRGSSPREVAMNYEDFDFQPRTTYHNQSNHVRGTHEWIAVEIPREWLEIEQI